MILSFTEVVNKGGSAGKGEEVWLDTAVLRRAHEEWRLHSARAQSLIFCRRLVSECYLLYIILIESGVNLGLRT